jgi:site-specific DNA-methyltransferase (adenine-specific)
MPQAQRTNWATPPALFDALAAEFGPFDLDPCGSKDSYASQHCGEFYTGLGLDVPWGGRVFVNPPYGLALRDWVYACWSNVRLGGVPLVVALLPARTDTRWWHAYIGDHCQYASEVHFLKGRLKFVGAKASAPFPSVIVVWRSAP